MNTKSIVITAAITSIVVSGLIFFLGGLVGNQSAEFLGGAIGITRYPNSALSARGLYVGTTVSSSISDGTATLSGTNTLSGVTTISGVTTLSGTTTTISGYACIKIPVIGSATTLYGVASTTTNTAGYMPLWATSTKPSYCP